MPKSRRKARMYSLYSPEIVNGRRVWTRVSAMGLSLDLARRVFQTQLIAGMGELRPIPTVKSK